MCKWLNHIIEYNSIIQKVKLEPIYAIYTRYRAKKDLLAVEEEKFNIAKDKLDHYLPQ